MSIFVSTSRFFSCSAPPPASLLYRYIFFILTLKRSWQSVGRCDITPPTSVAACLTHIHTQTPHTPDGVLSTPCFSERTKRYHLAKISFHRGNTTLRCYGPAETLKLLFRMIFFNKVDGVFPLKAPMCKLLFNLITTP